jgi:hypothetical protein
VNVKSGSTMIVIHEGTPVATSTGDINIESGDAVGGNGTSGNINIKTCLGNAARGDVTLEGTHIYIGNEGYTPGLTIYGLDDLHTLLYVDATGIHFAHPSLPKDIILPWGFVGTPPSPDGPGGAGGAG